MKLFAAKVFLVLLPVVVMVGANGIVDPAHLLREGPEREVARMLASGQRVAGLLDFDERRVTQHYIELMPAPLDVVVIGSSRTMQIRAGEFPGRSFFNASVSAEVIEDLIAICGELLRHQRLPGHLVIGMEPWLLNADIDHDGWQSLASSYSLMLDEMGLPSGPPRPRSWERYRTVLSPAYFQQVLRTIKWNRSLFIRVREPTSDAEAALMPDGSRRYPDWVRNRTPKAVRQLAIADASRYPEPFEIDFHELDPWAQVRLEALVTLLQAHGTTVSFFLPPFHPTLAALLRSAPEFQMSVPAEHYYRELAARLHVDVFGSFDAGACGCGEADFYDSRHPRESCVRKILHLVD